VDRTYDLRGYCEVYARFRAYETGWAGDHNRGVYEGLARLLGFEFSEGAFREGLIRQGAQDPRDLLLARVLWRWFERAAVGWGQAATPFEGSDGGFDSEFWDAALDMLRPHHSRLTGLRDEVRASIIDIMCDIARFAFGDIGTVVTSAELREIGVDDTKPED